MTNQAFPTVDGDECSWADIAVNTNIPGGANFDLPTLEAIKWSEKVDVGSTSGTSGGRVMKQTAGSLTSEASATISRSGVKALREKLAIAARAKGLVRGNEVIISGVRFDILIQHTPLGSTDIHTTKMTGCRYLGDSDDMKQGNDGDMIEITLNPIRIARKSDAGDWIVLR